MKPLLRDLRGAHVVLLAVTIALGLGSRHVPGLPSWLAKAPGDVLYATMAYWTVRLIAPGASAARAAIAATLFCFVVEASQLLHPAWLEAIRDTRLGGLVLGHGFHATDLLSYVGGAVLGAGVDRLLSHAPQRR